MRRWPAPGVYGPEPVTAARENGNRGRTPKPWPEAVEPPVEQAAEWLRVCQPWEREEVVEWMRTNSATANKCLMENHDEQVAALTAERDALNVQNTATTLAWRRLVGEVAALTTEVERKGKVIDAYEDTVGEAIQHNGKQQAKIDALTAEVERQKERGDLLRAEVHAAWRERDEALALLREGLNAPARGWRAKTNAFLAAVAPQEAQRVIVCGDTTDLYADWEPCDDETLAQHNASQEAAREKRWPYRDALSEAHQRQRKGLPCWCGQVSGHVGWLVCAHERASESTAPVEAQEVGE